MIMVRSLPVSNVSEEEPFPNMAGSSRCTWQSTPPGYFTPLSEVCPRYKVKGGLEAYCHITPLSINHTSGWRIGQRSRRRQKDHLFVFDGDIIRRNVTRSDTDPIRDDEVKIIHAVSVNKRK